MNEEEIKKENKRYFGERGGKNPPLQGRHQSLPLHLVSLGINSIEDLVGVGEIMALKKPDKASHKGQNGKLLIIGGSHLFHGASLWALKVASRVVDMVFYSSVPENNELVQKAKEEFRDGIVVPRTEINSYIDEADAVLIGPGMVRMQHPIFNIQHPKNNQIQNLKQLNKIKDEGEQTRVITEYLLKKYPEKQWVVDAGAIQVMEVGWIPKNSILTPHLQEFELLKLKVKSEKLKDQMKNAKLDEQARLFAYEYHCTVLLKGERDIITDGKIIKYAVGGNPGMTKGGTGDVLAGLVAAFACKNEPFLAARAGSFLNKLAGDMLYKKAGTMFNASDLCEEIPEAYKWALEN